MAFFRSAKVENYAPKIPAASPFLKASQQWDERIGAPTVRARNWRLACFGAIAVAGLSVGWNIYKDHFAPRELWAVPANAEGVIVGPVQRFAVMRYEPTRAQVARDIALWLEWVRTRPADGAKLRADILKAYAFMGDNAKRKLNEYNERFDPFAAYTTPTGIANKTVSMTFPKVLPMEGMSYHATWEETVWEFGEKRPPVTMTATFTASAIGQADDSKVSLNPAGTAIHDFDWRADK